MSETNNTLCIWDHLLSCSLGAIACRNQKTIRGNNQMKDEMNLIILKSIANIGELRNKPFSEEIKTPLASKYVHIKIIKRCQPENYIEIYFFSQNNQSIDEHICLV